MGRRFVRSDGTRRRLIALRENQLRRWPSSTPDERLAALKAGEPVLVSSAEVLRLGGASGISLRDVSYGGMLHCAMFVLDVEDNLVLVDDVHQGDG